MTNPSFPDYVKIGYADNVEKRKKELNRSECIPFAFRIYATYEVETRLQDKSVHEMIDLINPNLRSIENYEGKKRVREFYAMDAEDAYNIFKAIAHINSREDKLKLIEPSIKEVEEEEEAQEISRKAPNKDFYTMGLKDGDEIFLVAKPEIKVYIYSKKLVKEKDGEPTNITALATKLHERYDLIKRTGSGFSYFAYDDKDKNLYLRYNRIIEE